MKRLVAPVVIGALFACALSAGASASGTKHTWLYVEFDGNGAGTAENATPSGGSATMTGAWTFLYKLPAAVAGQHVSLFCKSSGCGGHASPYAVTGSGSGLIAGAINPSYNCSATISASMQSLAPSTALSWRLSGSHPLRVQTYSPMETGKTLADQSGACPVYGGLFAEGTGDAISNSYRQARLARNPGAVFTTDVGNHSSEPSKNTFGTPQTVSWSGELKLKLGGCAPTLTNLSRCFPSPHG
jgi:hypothetical protein